MFTRAYTTRFDNSTIVAGK